MTDSKQSTQITEQHSSALLTQLLSVCGIQDSFIDFSGDTRHINQEELLSVLAALGLDVRSEKSAADPEIIRSQLAMLLHNRLSHLLPPVAVYTRRSSNDDYIIDVNIPEHLLTGRLSWFIVSEEGTKSDEISLDPMQLSEKNRRLDGSTNYSKRHLPLMLTDLPTGYHQLTVSIGLSAPASDEAVKTVTQTIPLILAPSRCYEPDWSARGKKIWGLSVQLYSCCTERSWGIGDFFDLGNLIKKSAEKGVSYLILNPLHAGPLHCPEHCSPYSPVDRRRLNPLYIAPELEPEFATGKAGQWFFNDTKAAGLITQARNTDWIEYSSVAEVKIRVLSMMFEDFKSTGNADSKIDFEDFKTRTVNGLEDYACWQAQQGCAAAGIFSHTPEFYIYLQWLAEKQLAACQKMALSVGMLVGLVRDLAVGSDRHGAEVSLSHGVFSTAASIGAPPDPLAPQGQNWGLPPLNPGKLRDHAYRPFIDLLRSNMEYSGALRIDHVMSLMRLWWCPHEKSGKGAYVTYPADDLFAILRLESQRQQCLIIGEDLGIVPEEVRYQLNESGIYSNLLFYFEKASAEHYRSPEHYAPRSLAMLANHDVPTLAAWWAGSDLSLRRSLNLIEDDDKLMQEINTRQIEKKQVLQLLESQWLLPADRFAPDQLEKQMDDTLAAALIRCIARSSAMMVSVQLDDLLLLKLPVNIPGTSSEYKNWRRKMPVNCIAIIDDASVRPMLESLRVERQ